MKRTWMLVVLAVALMASACVNAGSQKTPAAAVIQKDVAFTLNAKPGKDTAEGLDLKVRLVDVNDSRCPKGVECVWAGKVSVTLEVSQNGAKAETVVLTLGGIEAEDQIGCQVGELYISLAAVDPYPDTRSQTAVEDLNVSLVVSEAPLG